MRKDGQTDMTMLLVTFRNFFCIKRLKTNQYINFQSLRKVRISIVLLLLLLWLSILLVLRHVGW